MNLNIGAASPVKAVQLELQSVELGSVNSVLSPVTTVHCMAGGGHIGGCVTLDIYISNYLHI